MAIKIKQVREKFIVIGKTACKVYAKTEDLNVGLLAVKAMSEATKSAVAQIRYKNQTGSPMKIDFLEE
jgi:hypothetical protein